MSKAQGQPGGSESTSVAKQVKISNANGYYMCREYENQVDARVLLRSSYYAHDPQNKWILDKDRIYDSSRKLVLGLSGTYAVMQGLSESVWQKWRQRGNYIVSVECPDICLQISDNGGGSSVVIGALEADEHKSYQEWPHIE